MHSDIPLFYPHLGGYDWRTNIVEVIDQPDRRGGGRGLGDPGSGIRLLSWVKSAHDPKIYEINADGSKHWMRMSWEDFERLTGGMYATVNDRELAWYTLGPDRLP